MKLARLEAEAVEAPPAAIGQRPSGKKGVRNRHPIPMRSLVVQRNLGRPSRCCPGHQACLECPAVSRHNSQEVEEVDDNCDEVRESLVTRRKESVHAREAAAPHQQCCAGVVRTDSEEADALNMFYGIECIDESLTPFRLRKSLSSSRRR